MAIGASETMQASPPASARPEVVPLSPALGAEIRGVDLRAPLDEATFRTILDAWHAHCIILIRGQILEPLDQVRFAERFGPLANVLNRHDGRTGDPATMLISNIRKEGKLIGALPDGEMMFHSDQCYIEQPCMATLLYAIEIPSKGGNTLFANMYKAYEAVPDDLKRRLDGMKAVNVYDYDNAATQRGSSSEKEDVPHFAHPIFRTHPATRKKALYVNRLMTEYIVGLPREESDGILEQLFDYAERRDFVYEHVWKPGDLIMWDNRCTLHARTDFDPSERRLLRRVVVLGEKPF